MSSSLSGTVWLCVGGLGIVSEVRVMVTGMIGVTILYSLYSTV